MVRTFALLLLTFFFRQMTELVRAGKIYIAQPPLYQIKRKKREEYVDDDVQLNKILISLGAEDVRLKNLADDKGDHGRAVERHSRVARETGEIKRSGAAARRRFRGVSGEAQFQVGKAAGLSRQSARWQRRDDSIISTTRKRSGNFIRRISI